MRPIDADALKDMVRADIDRCYILRIDGAGQLTHFLDQIDEQPTVNAAPVVYGRWETDKEDIEWGNSLKRKHCTNCGKRPHFDKEKRVFVLADFCHHCGAKMVGEMRPLYE